jgi:hypothetical protein
MQDYRISLKAQEMYCCLLAPLTQHTINQQLCCLLETVEDLEKALASVRAKMQQRVRGPSRQGD